MKSELENQKETTDGINNPDTTDETIWDDEELDIPDEMLDEIFDLSPRENDKSSKRPIPFYKDGFVPPSSNHSWKEHIFETPQKIYKYLNENVYGIDEYKRELAIFFWKCYHNKRPSGALLICGPSGCGKTEAIRAVTKKYKNIVIVDGSVITAQGWKGEAKLCTPLKNLDFSESANMPVYVLDEADKLFARAKGGWNESGLMAELLKLLEGGVVNVGTEISPKFVDTSKVAFILLGSFSGITDVKRSAPIGFGAVRDDTPVKLTRDAIDSILPPEVRGRIEQTIILEPFCLDDFKNIIKDKHFSPIRRIGNDLNIRLYVTKERAERIAHNAFVNHTGVRSMNNEINRAVNEILFENPDAKRIYIK